MKRFKFSLQPLRVLLERQEQVALLQYAETVATLEKAKKRLLATQHELESLIMLVQSRLNAHGPAAELAHLQDYCQTVEKEVTRRARDIQAAEKQAQTAFTKLVAARKASAVVHRYFQIQRRQYVRQQRHEEQKFLDELAQRQSSGPFELEFATENVWN